MVMIGDKKQDCCGCTACKSICPTKAITMKADEEGFLYPQIKHKLCSHCGLCRKVCAFQNGYDKSQNIEIPTAYAVKHKNMDIRLNSRSGGMFTAISDFVLKNSGVVYGVGYKDHFIVCHKRTTTKNQRDELRGSKYVQSQLDDIFMRLKKDLQENRWVLFSGTPCQTAGLNSFLDQANMKKDKLILCDIICHGTPTPKVWQDYLIFVENRYKGLITKVDFRNKELFGWHAHRETVEINGKIYDNNIYTKLFYKHDVLRPACFNCKYTNMKRPSDITLADFWGIDDVIVGFNDDKGVSLVFTNTEKGKWIFEEVKDGLDFKICTDTLFIHPNLKNPTKRPIDRDQFWEDYNEKGFEYILKKYACSSFKVRVKRVIVNLLMKLGLLGIIRKVMRRR